MSSIIRPINFKSLRAKIIYGIVSLLKGFRITIFYFSHPSTIVTQQYPENRATLKLADRTRSQLVFTYDDNGYHKCTACHICEEACPNASIHVVDRTPPTLAKDELDYFVWRLDTCTFCNLCVMVCPFQVLKMKPTFESSVFDQRLLVYNLNTYAGATGPELMKLPTPEERQAKIEPRTPYDGPTALSGEHLAGLPVDLYSKGAPNAKDYEKGARQ